MRWWAWALAFQLLELAVIVWFELWSVCVWFVIGGALGWASVGAMTWWRTRA
jgi:hypothetical protein